MHYYYSFEKISSTSVPNIIVFMGLKLETAGKSRTAGRLKEPSNTGCDRSSEQTK